MKRVELEHLIRAAADITEDEIVVIGSQAVLAEHPDAPEEMLESMEADVYPKSDPDKAVEIDGSLGDGSMFHATYGYFAHGVGPKTPVAPRGWEERLIQIRVPAGLPKSADAIGWCLEVHDVVLAKLAAGRPRDIDFAEQALRAGLVDPDRLRRIVPSMPESHRAVAQERVELAIARYGQAV